MSSTNDKINQFVQDTKDISPDQYELVLKLQSLIKSININADEEIKYGGLVFNVDGDLITGIFVRKNHISLEFSYGASFEDSNGFLEGKGKFRRHIKVRTPEDIEEKEIGKFVEICFQ